MSYYWTPTCETCGEVGPKIRSGGLSGLKFGPEHVTSTDLLKRWLDDHEHHDVRLRGEGMPTREEGNPAFRLSAGPVVITGLASPTFPGTRQILVNGDNKPLVIREAEGKKNSFVFPADVSEVIVPPHGTAVFVAKKPSRWQRLWGRLTGRVPALRWRYQAQEQETSDQGKSP